MLRWLYSFDYESNETKELESQFDFHVNVCTVSDKYGLTALKDQAFTRLVAYVEEIDDEELIGILDAVRQSASGYDEAVKKTVLQARDDRLERLLKDETFRTMLKEDPEECISLLDKHALGRVEKVLQKCNNYHCGAWLVSEKGTTRNCPGKNCRFGTGSQQKCWVKE